MSRADAGRSWIVFGAVFGFLGVAAGAFGAHALRAQLTERYLEAYQTGVRYHLVHALALLLLGALAPRLLPWARRTAGNAFVIGTLIFSGSLYLLAITGVRWFGMITPVGGVALLVGWAALAWGALRGGTLQT